MVCIEQGATLSGCLAALQEKVALNPTLSLKITRKTKQLIYTFEAEKLIPFELSQGLALQDVPPIKVLVLLAPAPLRAAHLKHVYEPPTLKVPTLAFLGTP